jgi:hypothetical protein
MKTNVIEVSSSGEGIDKALALAEETARRYGFTDKNTLYMRLLSEELMGMVRAVTGEMAADFWIEEENEQFALHLATSTKMHYEKRSELLSLSSSGKNAAAKGIMGKIRSIFEAAMMPESEDMPSFVSMGLMSAEDGGTIWMNPSATVWSLNAYRSGVEGQVGSSSEAGEAWDELERSIVANLADEVSVAIRGDNVEMVILKRFWR